MASMSAALTLAVVVPGYQSSFASVKGTGEMVSPPPYRGAVRGIENSRQPVRTGGALATPTSAGGVGASHCSAYKTSSTSASRNSKGPEGPLIHGAAGSRTAMATWQGQTTLPRAIRPQVVAQTATSCWTDRAGFLPAPTDLHPARLLQGAPVAHAPAAARRQWLLAQRRSFRHRN